MATQSIGLAKSSLPFPGALVPTCGVLVSRRDLVVTGSMVGWKGLLVLLSCLTSEGRTWLDGANWVALGCLSLVAAV